MSNTCKIFILAGESSGDLHGGYLMKSLKKINPQIEFFGIGGSLMEAEGLNSLVPLNKMSVMGFVEVLKHLPFFMGLKKKVLTKISQEQFTQIILIDYPGFNLNLLPKLKKITTAKITYYICPQIWAWKEKRIDLLKKYVDNKIVIFPFEPEWYKNRGVDVNFFGHPILDEWEPLTKEKLAEILNLNSEKPILTLYPGSRDQEFNKHISILIEAAKIIKNKIPDIQVIVGCAKSIDISHFSYNFPDWLILEMHNPQLSLEIADVAIIASGTSTLEAAVFGTPGVIVYKLSPISWWLSKLFVKVKFAGMVNLIANKEIMPELLQNDANPEKISQYILELLENPKKYEEIKMELLKVKNSLGEKGVCEKIAKNIMGLN